MYDNGETVYEVALTRFREAAQLRKDFSETACLDTSDLCEKLEKDHMKLMAENPDAQVHKLEKAAKIQIV